MVRRLVEASAELSGISQSTSYGTPSLKVGKKFICRIKDAKTVVITCPLEEKAVLREVAPDIYFETDHYKGWPAILVRIDAISDRELAHRLACAARFQAPPRKDSARLRSPRSP